MFAKLLRSRIDSPVFMLLLAVSFIVGCGSGTPAPTPTQPAQPTPKTPPTITLDVSPGRQVSTGQGVAIVVKVGPYEKLDWNWEVSGTSGGQLNSKTGEQVVYTAGGREGVDIVLAEAKTADGETVKQTVSLTVVAVPITAMPAQPSTPMTAPSTVTPSASTITLEEPQMGQTVACQNIAKGTYPVDLKDNIWPVVYVSDRYYPQDEGGKAAQKVSGNWFQTVRFGECDQLQKNVGRPFQLIIVTANEAANAEFEEYIKTGAAKGWQGLSRLPVGTQEHVRIIVIRQ